jgi:small-conductance mechanosensitive channel
VPVSDMRASEILRVVMPAALVALGVAVGLVLERFLLPRLSRQADRRGSAAEALLVASLRGVLLVWAFAAGIYAALLAMPLAAMTAARIERLLLLLIIPSITVVLARLAAGVVSPYSRRVYRRDGGAGLPSPSIVTNLTRLVIFALGGLMILQSFGIAITPILTALGVGGLAVALALQETLSNLFSGLYIIAARQIKPGDHIKLNTGEEGYVVDITWRNTKPREIPNNMIIAPNAKLASATSPSSTACGTSSSSACTSGSGRRGSPSARRPSRRSGSAATGRARRGRSRPRRSDALAGPSRRAMRDRQAH